MFLRLFVSHVGRFFRIKLYGNSAGVLLLQFVLPGEAGVDMVYYALPRSWAAARIRASGGFVTARMDRRDENTSSCFCILLNLSVSEKYQTIKRTKQRIDQYL